MNTNLTIKTILLLILIFFSFCTTFAQYKLDNKSLPISKLNDKSLLELLDSIMLNSFDNTSVNYLINQQKTVKFYPLSFIYGIDYFSRFPFDVESYTKNSQKIDIKSLDFTQLRGNYFNQYYLDIRNNLDTNILKQIKVNLNFENSTELDEVLNEKRLKGHLVPFLKNNFNFFNSFASINQISRIEIDIKTFNKIQEDYLNSDNTFLEFIRSQIHNDIIWIKVHNDWKWINFFK